MLRNHPFLPLMALSFALTLAGCSKKEEAAPSTSAAPAEAPVTAESAAGEPTVGAPTETPPAEPAPAAATETVPPAVAAPAAAAETGTAPPPAAESAPAPAESADVATPAKPINGEAIAQGICMACHQAGMNGAPKFANKVAWAPRIAQGREKLYENAIKGLRGMPARGGNPNLSDEEVKAAVDYMVKVAGGYKE
jgi:cytochrome c5